MKEVATEYRYKDIPAKTAVINYVGNAVVVVAAAVFLPKIGIGIAESTGLGQTFVGNIFIAFSTSLPEVVVSLSAIKMDAIDLAIGNLFGSNIFNILILAIDDVLFFKGPVLFFASQEHIISALSAIAMTTIAIIGLTYRAEKKFLFLAWDSIGIIMVYFINILMLYSAR
jgi:cation:H+ antiporter